MTNKQAAKQLLVHYFGLAGVRTQEVSDLRAEIEEIVDLIILAVKEELKEERDDSK